MVIALFNPCVLTCLLVHSEQLQPDEIVELFPTYGYVVLADGQPYEWEIRVQGVVYESEVTDPIRSRAVRAFTNAASFFGVDGEMSSPPLPYLQFTLVT